MSGEPGPSEPLQEKYLDKLVEISHESIRFRNYYFPFGSKLVPFSEVDRVVVETPTLMAKWRIHGTADFKTWFPRDWRRPSRDRLFVMTLQTGRRRIAFTVEDSDTVIRIFRDNGLLHEATGPDN